MIGTSARLEERGKNASLSCRLSFIIAYNSDEPIVLEDKNCLPGVAFENTARRLTGEKVNFLNLESMSGKNPVKRIIGKLINRSNSY